MRRLSPARHHLTTVVGLAAVAVAMGGVRPEAAPSATEAHPQASRAEPRPAVPTVAEGERWGEEFATALAARGARSAAQKVDCDALFAIATNGAAVPESFRQRFVAEGTRSVARSGFVAQLAQAASAGGSVAPVRCRVDGDECHLLLRVIQDTGLNYYDVVLVRRGPEIVAADAYVFLAGEQLSATMRRFLLIAAAAAGIPPAPDAARADAVTISNAETLRELLAAADASDHAHVLELAGRLPADVLAEKPILMARAIAAIRSGVEQRSTAFDDLRAAFPDDACVELVAIDHHARNQDRNGCLEAIDRLDDRLGGDPYLDVLRATVHVGGAEYPEAIRAAEAAIKALPRLPQPYWIRLAIALEQKQHEDTAAWLDIIAERFGVAFPDLESIPEYAAFVQSPEYRAWRSRRGN